MSKLSGMRNLEQAMYREARDCVRHLRFLAPKRLNHSERCEVIRLEAEASTFIKLAMYECGMSAAAKEALLELEEELADVLEAMRRLPPKNVVVLVRPCADLV
jgi:hypothetical protein